MNSFNTQFGNAINRKSDVRPGHCLIFDPTFTGYRGLEASDLQLKQYSGISNFTVGTANGTILAANSNRTSFNVQNLNTGILYLKLGAGCTNNTFSFILKKGTTVDDGNAGSILEPRWTGIVSVSGESGPGSAPRYIAWEG